MTKFYIGDGYDREFHIVGSDGLYPTCRFDARVMVYEQTHEVLMRHEQTGEKDLKQRRFIYAAAIAGRLTHWDWLDEDDLDGDAKPRWKPFTDAAGNRLEITPQNVLNLPYELFNRLRDIIFGLRGGDAFDGRPGLPTAEQDEKNSAAGSG